MSARETKADRVLTIADLFCGAGGTSTGAITAARALGYTPRLTAVNHWPVAVATHTENHPDARHLCASLDSLNPRDLFKEGELDVLWASPECTHHSVARGGKPINDQSRATAWCVTRWADALRPSAVMVENVPEFASWGPCGSTGRPIQSRKGEVFRAWVATLEALGYRVDWRELCAADYGDPTSRTRLFVQAVRGKRRIVWPEATHSAAGDSDLLRSTRPWRSARSIIDWDLPGNSIFARKRPLAPRTMERIKEGLERFGMTPWIICMEHGGRVVGIDRPVPTITTAKAGAMALAEPFLLPQQSGGRCRPVTEPVPTVAASGAIALVEPFLVEYYGNGGAQSVDQPIGTVTTHDRFALVEPRPEGSRLDIRFRMLQPHELAAAQGFPSGYRFTGTKTEVVKQIGNAVPCGLSRAIVSAFLTQNPVVGNAITA